MSERSERIKDTVLRSARSGERTVGVRQSSRLEPRRLVEVGRR